MLEHFRGLVTIARPGMSDRQICEAAGDNGKRLAYYLKRGTTLTQMPTVETQEVLAEALDFQLMPVVETLAADVGQPLPRGPALTEPDEILLVEGYRTLSPADKRMCQQLLVSLSREPKR